MTVEDGVFTVELNAGGEFGVNPFAGNDLNQGAGRWLEIAVRVPAGSGDYSTLSPRQLITPTPFAWQTRGMTVDSVNAVTFGPSAPNPFKVNINPAGSQLALRLLSSDPIGTRFRIDNADGGGRLWDLISTGTGNANGDGKLLFVDATSGTAPRIAVDSAGNVGIGQVSPTHRLHAQTTSLLAGLFESSSTVGTWLNLNNSSTGGRYWKLISTGSGNSGGAGKLLIGSSDTPSTVFGVMTMQPDGRIGLGTVSPAARLDVNGDVKIDDGIRNFGSYSQSALGVLDVDASGVAGGRLRVTETGLVGIGTPAPKALLHVNGDYYGKGHILLHAQSGDGVDGAAFIQARDDSGTSNIGMVLRTQSAGSIVNAVSIDSVGRVAIGGPALAGFSTLSYLLPGETFALYADGLAGGITPWFQNSDARFKHNVETLDSALSTLANLRGVRFEWDRARYPEKNFPEGSHVGFIAQEVREQLPEIVRELPDGHLTVAYSEMTPLLVEAIKEQQEQIACLRAELDSSRRDAAEVREENADLRARFSEFSDRLERLEQR
ncbi:MAG: tail fiber domain-containing protein [Phycisphaerales bacterium]|nr:tail fiber domain-containing protein [Phycisphaerales bacterium]